MTWKLKIALAGNVSYTEGHKDTHIIYIRKGAKNTLRGGPHNAVAFGRK